MKNMTIIIILLVSSLAQASWDQYLDQEILSREGLEAFFPDSDELELPFKLNKDYVSGKEAQPHQIQRKKFACGSKTLWPTHPQQSTKEYLYAGWAHFRTHRLPPDSSACLRKNPTGKYCLRATSAQVMVLSDTYQDTCGNYYRAYWLTAFLRSDESMGTLGSQGRSFYVDEDGSNFRLGTSFPVKTTDFLFLGELKSNDMARIQRDRAEALKNGIKLKGQEFISPH